MFGSSYKPYELSSLADITSDNLLNNASGDVLYYFYANGAGLYYNRLSIRGVRNTDLEKQFIDADGNPLYKYMFMDIAVYEQQDNGNQMLVEGPWTVSLIPRYPNDQSRTV